MNIDELVQQKSRFLRKEEIGESLVVTIKGFARVEVDDEDRGCVYFEELEKPLLLGVTNRDLLKLATGTEDTREMKGQLIELWHDPTISFGGKIVGGLRIRRASGSAPKTAAADAAPDDELL